MLDTLVTSKTRIKLLLKFFLNSRTRGYLRHLESEFGESTNAIRLELNKFEKAGMLRSSNEGNKKVFKANTTHPLFPEVQAIVRKYVGIDKIIEKVVGRVGDLQLACLVGDYARGLDTGTLEFLLVGRDLDEDYLGNLASKAESMIQRTISFSIMNSETFEASALADTDCLVLWES